ncbi:hypothetical protein BDZ45DRAFT_586543 [Acephala macrosclerotiorum]|nr:hypothetical protein BDZ45DRAFT_586543 [Acephala macrosclerotiorum]
MDNKYSEKVNVSDGSVVGLPAVEYGQILDYPGEDVKEHCGDLHRTFKARHIQMICLGGCIGSGIFIISTSALRYGNYTGMYIGWTFICTMSWTVMQVMSEACCIFPTSGAFVNHAARFVDPALGFATGFCEWFGWITVVAAEGAIFQTIISYWTTSIPTAACMTIYLVVVFAIHIFPNRMFAEFEFGTTGGQEIMNITNEEADMPRWNLPRACNQLLIRIFIFYLGSVTLIAVLVPRDLDHRYLTIRHRNE